VYFLETVVCLYLDLMVTKCVFSLLREVGAGVSYGCSCIRESSRMWEYQCWGCQCWDYLCMTGPGAAAAAAYQCLPVLLVQQSVMGLSGALWAALACRAQVVQAGPRHVTCL
jgi:hypothetical protein